ncbi:MAG: sigma-70 family RNA polymerase sigma factor [Planctomycetota bacterium]
MIGLEEDHLVRRAVAGDRLAFCVLTERYHNRMVRYLKRMVRDLHLAQDLAQEVFLRAYESLHRLEHVGSFRAWLFRIAFHIAIDHLRRRPRRQVSLDEIGDCAEPPRRPRLHAQLRETLLGREGFDHGGDDQGGDDHGGDDHGGPDHAGLGGDERQREEQSLHTHALQEDTDGYPAGPLEYRLSTRALHAIKQAMERLPSATRLAMQARYLGGLSCGEIAREMGWSVANAKVRLHRGRRAVRRQLRQTASTLFDELAAIADPPHRLLDTASVKLRF